MKCYVLGTGDREDGFYLLHAETPGKAKAELCRQISDVEFIYCSAARVKELDDKPINADSAPVILYFGCDENGDDVDIVDSDVWAVVRCDCDICKEYRKSKMEVKND
jgi:hypothetical protein